MQRSRTHGSIARLDGADLQGAVFGGGSVDSTSFRGTKLQRASFRASPVRRSDFTEADLSFLKVEESSFNGSIFYKAVLRNADLSGAYLINNDLRGADLQEATLPKLGRLRGASLCGADLRRADLRNTGSDVGGWRQIKSLTHANVAGVRNAPANFVQWAVDSMQAVAVESGEEWRLRDLTPAERHTSRRPPGTWAAECPDSLSK